MPGLAQKLAESTNMHVLCCLPVRKSWSQNGADFSKRQPYTARGLSLLAVDPKAKSLPIGFASSPTWSLRRARKPVSRPENSTASSARAADVLIFRRRCRRCGDYSRTQAIPQNEIHKRTARPSSSAARLPGAFDWDSKAEADERVRWPLEFQWFGEPNGQLLVSRHAKPRTPIPANGRLFIFGESHLTARRRLQRRRTLATPIERRSLHGSATSQCRRSLSLRPGRRSELAARRSDRPTCQGLWQDGRPRGPFAAKAAESDRKRQTRGSGDDRHRSGKRCGITLTLTTAAKRRLVTIAGSWRSISGRPPIVSNAPGSGTFELIVDPWKGRWFRIAHSVIRKSTVKTLPGEKDGRRTVALHLAANIWNAGLGRKLTDFALAADVKLWTDDFRLRLWGRPLVAGANADWLNEAEAIVVLRSGRQARSSQVRSSPSRLWTSCRPSPASRADCRP